MSARDIVFLPLRELSALIASRQLSPVEVAEAFLDRLESLGPRLNAVVTVTRERALRDARRAEQEIAGGDYRGALHGVPYGAKDLLATAEGVPTTWGAEPFRWQVFEEDATVIQRLDEAGGALAAKLAMVELAGGMGYRQPNAAFTGPAHNPWNEGHWTGGSSTGSAAAVAAGLVPFAIGSETYGSIIGPAGFCGLSGLRPTYGRVSRAGAMPLCWTLDKLGPLCLSADDCGIVLEAIAGPDDADASTTDDAWRYLAGASDHRPRLGLVTAVRDWADSPAQANFDAAVDVLEQVADIEEIELPDLPFIEATQTILQAESIAAFDDFFREGGPANLTARETHAAPYARYAIPAADYLRALRLRDQMGREVLRAMEGFDAIIAPSRRTEAPPIEGEFPPSMDLMGGVGNACGLPAITVPDGFGPQGLPTGLLVLGRAYEENAVLAVARAYQSLTDWHQRHPTAFEAD